MHASVALPAPGPAALFAGAEMLHTYTRADAIADGTLVDMQQGDMREVVRQHVGTMPCAMTRALWSVVEKAVANKRQMNDLKGVVHDILWMGAARARCLKVLGEIDRGARPLSSLPLRWAFRVIITGAARQRTWQLWMTMCHDDDGHPALLFGMPGED